MPLRPSKPVFSFSSGKWLFGNNSSPRYFCGLMIPGALARGPSPRAGRSAWCLSTCAPSCSGGRAGTGGRCRVDVQIDVTIVAAGGHLWPATSTLSLPMLVCTGMGPSIWEVQVKHLATWIGMTVKAKSQRHIELFQIIRSLNYITVRENVQTFHYLKSHFKNINGSIVSCVELARSAHMGSCVSTLESVIVTPVFWMQRVDRKVDCD